jgi:hypothetical protein
MGQASKELFKRNSKPTGYENLAGEFKEGESVLIEASQDGEIVIKKEKKKKEKR